MISVFVDVPTESIKNRQGCLCCGKYHLIEDKY